MGSDGSHKTVLARLRDEQERSWRRGEGVPLEHLLTQQDLSPEHQLDLIYNEFLLREELQQAPDANKYLERFPQYRSQLQRQFEVHDALLSEDFVGGELDTPTRYPGSPASGNADAEAKSGKVLGDFRILHEIGRGGMGVVYEAEQISLERRVALTVLPSASAFDSRQLARFKNEALIAAQLTHPHIVKVIAVGSENSVHFFAMELIVGNNLARLIRDWRGEPRSDASHAASPGGRVTTPPQTYDRSATSGSTSGHKETQRLRHVALFCKQVADALEYAHQLGVLHRDVKPSNIIVDAEDKARLTDFGLARHQDAELTVSGDVLGTLRYMSPEQAMGRRGEVSQRSDIYGLGATLYELATLQPMIPGQDRDAVRAVIADRDPIFPRKINSRIPRDLETIILKATQAESSQRYASAGDFAADLQRFLNHEPIHARRPSVSDRMGKWARRHRTLAAVGCAAVFLLCAVLAVSTLRVWHAQSRTQVALNDSRRHVEQVEDLLYISDMQFAYQAWDRQRIDQVSQILDRQRPAPGRLDRRGFEWYLLNTLAKQPEPRVLGKHDGPANELAVFPDRQRVASVGDDGQLRIWHIDSGKLLTTIDAGQHPLYSVAVSPDGSTVATGSEIVQLWNSQTGALEIPLTWHESNVESIAFSPDGQRIVTASRYDQLRLFSRFGELLKEIEEGSRHESLEFTADGTRLLVPSRLERDDRKIGFVRVWSSDLAGVERDFFVTDPSRSVPNYTLATSSPDGTFYALSERYHRQPTRLFDARTGEELLRLPPHRDQVSTTAISPDGRIIAAGFNDGTIDYWGIARTPSGDFMVPDRTYSVRAHRGRVSSARFAGANRLVTCGGDGLVKSWDLQVGANPKLVGSVTREVAVSPDGRTLALACVDSLHLTTADGDLIVRHEPVSASLNHVAFSRDGKLLATCCFYREIVELRDARSGAVVHSFSLGSRADTVCFSPVRDELVAVTGAGDVCFLDPRTRAEIARVSVDGPRVGSGYVCQYSPDGRFLVCGGEFGEITIVDPVTHNLVRSLPVVSHTRSLAFDPAGTVLASGHDDASIRLWDWPAGNLRAALVGHEGSVSGLAFSPDGRTIASISQDGTTRLWSAVFERECGVVYRARGGWDVAFSPDGSKLYAAYSTGPAGLPGLAIFTSGAN